jgi:hypothetical protein
VLLAEPGGVGRGRAASVAGSAGTRVQVVSLSKLDSGQMACRTQRELSLLRF